MLMTVHIYIDNERPGCMLIHSNDIYLTYVHPVTLLTSITRHSINISLEYQFNLPGDAYDDIQYSNFKSSNIDGS